MQYISPTNLAINLSTLKFYWLELVTVIPSFLKIFSLKKTVTYFYFQFSTAQIIKDTADLVTFTEEILSGKLHFLCSLQNICQKIKFQWL